MKRNAADTSARNSNRASPVRKVKLAEKIAGEIMTDIRTRGWPVGEFLGTQDDLLARYRVSRATLSEAIRVVEAKGAARMMRGRRGGLMVCAPALDTVVRTISNYLDYANTSLEELIEAFCVIETLSVRTATERISGQDLAGLHGMVAEIDNAGTGETYRRHLMAIRLAIADASGNPALAIFMRVLVRTLTYLVWRRSPLPATITPQLHAIGSKIVAMVEAIGSGHASVAEAIVRNHLQVRVTEQARTVQQAGEGLPEAERTGVRSDTRDHKAAERIARKIVVDIRRSGLQPGERLGQEAELMERYGTSRWVMRQAVRALEVNAIVHSKRGQGGGLTIASPDPSHTIEAAQTYLHAANIPPHEFAELWHGLLDASAQHAARRASPESLTTLRAAADAVKNAPFETVRERHNVFYIALAAAGENRVFHLLIMILSGYLANFKVRVSQPSIPESIEKILEQLTGAVSNNDEADSRRLAREYSDLIKSYVTFIDKYTPAAELALTW